MSDEPKQFIHPKVDWLTITFFKWYVKFLCKIRFQNVWLSSNYKADNVKSTLFLLNHNYWWDGIIPLLLNEFVFRQNARAVMEDKQMQKYPFFARIGAFSIERTNLRSSIYSLDFGGKWLEGQNHSLYLYPEGKITSPSSGIVLESGFTRILKNYRGFDTVLIALLITYDQYDKPELYIDVSESLNIRSELSKSEIVQFVRQNLQDMLHKLNDPEYRKRKNFNSLV